MLPALAVLACLGMPGAAGAAGVLGADAAAVRPAMLDRPAAITERAAKQLLLAAAHAGKRIVAVGQTGNIVLSDDGGKTWQPAKSVPTSATLTTVAFANENEGWTAGHLGVVLHTRDGGQTWERQLDGVQAAKLVYDAAEQRAASDNSDAARKALRAAQFLVKDGPNKPFLKLVATDAQHVRVFGAFGLALATEDGGKTWTPAPERFDNPSGLHYYDAERTGSELLVVGEQGMVLRGSSGGSGGELKKIDVPYKGTMFGVLAAPGGSTVAYGLRGTVLVSKDHGASWSKVESGVPASIQAGAVLKDGTVLLGSESGQLIASRDGGARFASLASVTQPAANILPVSDRAILVLGPRGAERVDLSAERELK